MPPRKRTRNTGQRRAILDAIRASGGHPTAAEVFTRVRERGGYPRLSLATVYRALDALVEQGDILEMRVGGVGRYDGGVTPHHHVVCRTCGHVTDVPAALLPPDLMNDLGRASGYRVDPGQPIQFVGQCSPCLGEAASSDCAD